MGEPHPWRVIHRRSLDSGHRSWCGQLTPVQAKRADQAWPQIRALEAMSETLIDLAHGLPETDPRMLCEMILSGRVKYCRLPFCLRCDIARVEQAIYRLRGDDYGTRDCCLRPRPMKGDRTDITQDNHPMTRFNLMAVRYRIPVPFPGCFEPCVTRAIAQIRARGALRRAS